MRRNLPQRAPAANGHAPRDSAGHPGTGDRRARGWWRSVAGAFAADALVVDAFAVGTFAARASAARAFAASAFEIRAFAAGAFAGLLLARKSNVLPPRLTFDK